MFRVRRFSVISTANTVAITYFIGFLILHNLTARFTGGFGVDVRAQAPPVTAPPTPSYPPQQG